VLLLAILDFGLYAHVARRSIVKGSRAEPSGCASSRDNPAKEK
jgi:hypothetical protein